MEEKEEMTEKEEITAETTEESVEEVPAEEEPIKQTKTQLFWEIFRFLLVGGIATIADYAVFGLFDSLLLPLIPVAWGGWETLSLGIATALGFIVGMIVNWLMSISFVFKAVKNKEESRSKKSFLIFVIISVIGLAITQLGIYGLVAILPEFSLFGSKTFLGTTWAKWLAKAVMTCIVLVWNYVGRKLFVFKS